MATNSTDSAPAIPSAAKEPSKQTLIHSQSVIKNSILLVGFYVLTKLLSLVSFVLLANHLGTQVFGVYNYSLALTALFIPLCDLGLDTYLMREIPRETSEQISKKVGAVLIWKGVLTSLVFIAISITGGILDSFGTERFYLVALAGVVTLFRTYWTTFGSVFRALDKVNYETGLSSLARIAEFLVIVFAIMTNGSLAMLFSLLALVNIVAVISTYVVVKARFIRPTLQQNFPQMLEVLKEGLPFALAQIFTSVYFNIDTVFISKFIGDESAGIYRAAYNLILPLIMITAAVSGAVFPFVSQNFRIQKSEVVKVIQQSSVRLLMIGLPIATITTMLAAEIIKFLFAPEYAPAAICLSIVVWFLPLFYVSNLFGNVLGAMDQQLFVMKITALNVLFNIIVNLLIIPRFAQLGASVTTVLTQLVGFLFMMARMRSITTSPIPMNLLAKIFLACATIAAFLLLKINVHVIVLIGVSLGIYIAVLFAVKGITTREVRRIFQSFQASPGDSR